MSLHLIFLILLISCKQNVALLVKRRTHYNLKSSTKLNNIFDTMFSFATNKGKDAGKVQMDQIIIDSFVDRSPSWTELDTMIREKELKNERDTFDAQQIGRGPANSKATIRLFDAPDGTVPSITLYRDTAAWCPYCEKVWLYLEEKRIPYKVEKVPLRCYGEKPSSFLRLNPSGGLPVAIINGKVMSESNDIIFAIEEMFQGYKQLLPTNKNSAEFQRVTELMRLERQVFSVWFRWLTSPSNMESQMHAALLAVDRALAVGGLYFLGDDISVIDILFTPFLERMAASLPYYKGFLTRDQEKYPNLYRWYVEMDSRPTYQGIKSDYYTHCHDLPPQIGECISVPGSEKYSERIDGADWDVAISEDQCFEPMIPSDAGVSMREAARAVIANHRAVSAFAARGALVEGHQIIGNRVSAPLANPNMKPNEQIIPLVDSALRGVVYNLISNEMLAHNEPNKINVEKVIKPSLLYLRDRVGVPRDMSIHAARMLRAHINYYVNSLTS